MLDLILSNNFLKNLFLTHFWPILRFYMVFNGSLVFSRGKKWGHCPKVGSLLIVVIFARYVHYSTIHDSGIVPGIFTNLPRA